MQRAAAQLPHLIVNGSRAAHVLLDSTAVEVGITHGQQAGDVALGSATLQQAERHIRQQATCNQKAAVRA